MLFKLKKQHIIKKETTTRSKKPYIFAVAASIVGIAIALPIYQQYLKPLSYQEEYKTKAFVVYETQITDNPLKNGEILKKELENHGLSVEIFNDGNTVSIEISTEKKPNKDIIDYLKLKNITYFLPPPDVFITFTS